MRRRTFIGSLLATSLSALMSSRTHARKPERPHIAVIGAGAFGGWTALHLLKRGARVTCLDAWGPGNSRASSGGETRVIRHCYSSGRYVRMAQRSVELWKQASENWGRPLFEDSGVLFMRQEGFGEDFFNHAIRHMKDAGVPHEELTGAELARRYPQIDVENAVEGIYEPTAGYLLARRACAAVIDELVALGGEYRMASASPGTISSGEMTGIELANGETLRADQYVFACGPWLAQLFPSILAERLSVSRQEVFFFGYPGGDRRYALPALPVWADLGERFWYGIPGAQRRGFKIADDTRGPALDPTTSERRVSEEGLRSARAYVARRFPGLEDAPLLESRVCQYTNTPDEDFIVDRHPGAENVWLMGGGSGHGFKHGPALGEMAAAQVMGLQPLDPAFALERFD